MILSAVFQRFLDQSPISVMARGAMEYALSATDLDRVFAGAADRQYTRSLLFSALTDLMSTVVCRIRPSVHAAYQADPGRLGVSVRAVYDKLSRLEPGVTEAVVAHTAARLAPVVHRLTGRRPGLLPGYRVRVLDGNHLAATDRRLGELRGHAAGPLPGQALVVYDPDAGLVTAMVGCEDGHAQERASLPAVLGLVRPREVWVADRNFCTTGFLIGLVLRRANFVIRQHRQTLYGELVGRRRAAGRCGGGRVWEQAVALRDGNGLRFVARRVTIRLDTPTRDGDAEVHVLTNLPTAVPAARVADLYRKRWTIEKDQADYPSSRGWVSARRTGYHRGDGAAGTGRVVSTPARRRTRRIRMSAPARRLAPPAPDAPTAAGEQPAAGLGAPPGRSPAATPRPARPAPRPDARGPRPRGGRS